MRIVIASFRVERLEMSVVEINISEKRILKYR